MKVSIKKPEKRLHTGHWKGICGLLVMVSAIAVVWAILASVTLWQRERELAKATEELIDLREDVYRLEERERVNSERDVFLDEYLPEPDVPTGTEEDPFAIFEDEMGLIPDEE